MGDAEILSLIVPRYTIIEYVQYPEWKTPDAVKGRRGAAPGILSRPANKGLTAELRRYPSLVEGIKNRPGDRFSFLGAAKSGSKIGPGALALQTFLEDLQGAKRGTLKLQEGNPPKDSRASFDPAIRLKRQFDQLTSYTLKLHARSDATRNDFIWSKLDTTSIDKYEASTKPFRKYFHEEVIGKLPKSVIPLNPRTRLAYDTPKWKGYEVVLDVYPDVFAYGILCVPKDLKPGEKRPVVVCQHGLEGTPQHVVNPKENTRAYNSFGAQLADLGYIVYAPQNPYIGKDLFRVLQRKANPLKLSLFSFIIRQHERTLDWLETLPYVDKEKMAFYGLSYGGKTAMRVPAVLPRYCLSICSGDFNEWIGKNVRLDIRISYMFTVEYEMFEYDLGNTFNYAEMAALIAPRPFMVERGHDDGVGIDEMVAYEYAKVRRLYSRLKLPERTAIEFFAGRHEINGKGTFAFLKQHLGWPKK